MKLLKLNKINKFFWNRYDIFKIDSGLFKIDSCCGDTRFLPTQKNPDLSKKENLIRLIKKLEKR